MTRAAVHAVHLCAWAVCYASITFTYFRLNAQVQRFVATEEEAESIAAATAGGLHAWILGAIVVAAMTGCLLLLWRPQPAPASWWALMTAKIALTGALAAIELWIDRVMWPRRRRLSGTDIVAVRRTFYRITFLMGFFLLCQLALGTLAGMVARSHAR